MTLLQGLALLTILLVLAFTVKNLPLEQVKKQSLWQHRLGACLVALCFLWMFQTRLHTGLDIHFLGVTAVTLVLGFRWSIVITTMATVFTLLLNNDEMAILGIEILCGAYIPIALSYVILMASFHHLPRNPFSYIFVCGFAAGALAILVKFALLAGYYWLDGTYTWQILFDKYLIITPLMVFPEAMLNGMIATFLLVYAPQWLYTYQDKFYLND